MKKIMVLSSLIFFNFFLSSAQASWLIYHKPEFKGKVIDEKTKEPIQGAVVAVYYKTNTYNIAGGGTRIIHTKETLTDENGEFVIPSYTTLFSPFTTSQYAGFIIYKPGYGGFPNKTGSCVEEPEDYFSVEMQGIQSECVVDKKAYPFSYGVIEMPKLTTREERLRAIPGRPSGLRSKDLPLLYQLINSEYTHFGYKGVN